MSKSGPSVFVVVGETDSLSLSSSLRHAEIAVDSRLRTVRRDYNNATYRSALSAGSREVPHGARFATLRVITGNANTAGNAFGLMAVGSEFTTSYPGSASGSVGAIGGGDIYHNGAAVQTGLATFTTGDVIGLRLYRDGSSLKVQFYKNAATFGTPVTLTDTAYRLVVCNAFTGTEYLLSVDADDPDIRAFIPANTQPWGAAARVADAGGYSRAASKFDRAASATPATVDAYGCSLTAGTNGAANSYFSQTRSHAGRDALIYCEFFYEQTDANDLQIGLANASKTSGYIGSDASSWGYAQLGTLYHSGSGTASGVTYTSGDYPGVVWHPSSGKVWFTKNGTPLSGDPEAGTGAHYSNATGALQPAATVWSTAAGRVRLITHARGQVYRPSYCEAWDGADLLPELHFRDTIVGDTEITFGIWFPFPWGGSRRTGSPLGTVVLNNADGRYDPLRWYNLRDEELIVYETVDDTPQYLARVLCDSVQLDSESTVSIASRGLDCLLDVRIDEPAALFGQPLGLVPGNPISGTSLIWDIAHTEYFSLSALLDEGVALTYGSGWFHCKPVTAQGWRLGANPAGTLAASSPRMFRRSTQVSLTNSNFTAWTGDNPDGWTVTESAGTAEIKQNGNGARFHRTSGSALCTMTQAISPPSMSENLLFLRINVSAYVSGDLRVDATGTPDHVGINGTGVYVVPLTGSSTLEIRCSDAVTDLTIDDVELWHCTDTSSRAHVFEYLLEDYGGLTEAQYDLGTPPSAYTGEGLYTGYWTRDRPTVREIVDELCQTWLCDYYTSPAGVLTFVSMEEPSAKTPSGTLLETDGRGPMSVSDDLAPALTNGFLYNINFHRYSDSDLAGAVPSAERALYTAEGVINRTALTYHAFYAHATGAPAKPVYSNAATLIRNQLEDCYTERKWFFEREYDAEAVRDYDPGDYLTVKANRFGLSSGAVLMLVSKTRRLKSPMVRCKFWGST